LWKTELQKYDAGVNIKAKIANFTTLNILRPAI